MEFDFDLNKVLPSTITFVDHKRSPFRNHAQNTKLLQKQLDKVIDSLGNESSKAQGLHTVITTAIKLKHSDHEMYILKDADANGGLGAAVGMIKVGKKTLFLTDIHGIQHEVVPLCVLDFFVHPSQQRTGLGKKLFEHMLQLHNLQASQVAIDRPSYKFQSFLKKHYGLKNSLSQPNKFLVFDQFFRDLNAVGYVPRRSQRMRSSNTAGRPPVHPYQRNSAKEPPGNNHQHAPPRRLSLRRNSRKDTPMDIDCNIPSNDITSNIPSGDAISNTSHGDVMKIVLPPLAKPASREHSAGSVRSTDSAGSRESDVRGLAAQASLYSRHGSSGTSRGGNLRGQILNRNAVSAGITKSLHASSQDNPLAIGGGHFAQSYGRHRNFTVQSPCNTSAMDTGVFKTTGKPTALTSTGNYTVSSVLGSQQPSCYRGTSWNVFGIPPVETSMKSSSQKYSRTFPF